MNTGKNNQNITHIDATGLNCPMPLVLLKKAITKLKAGDCIQIEVTDEHAELDFEIWCERFGHELIKASEINSVLTFHVTVDTA